MPEQNTLTQSVGNPAVSTQIVNGVLRVKELRRDVDTLIQRTKELPPSRERAIAITKLQEGVMWLGMDLKRVGEEYPGLVDNPYPNSKDPSTTKIDPTADGLKL